MEAAFVWTNSLCISSSILNQSTTNSTRMISCLSFWPQMPSHLTLRPISSFRAKPLSALSIKALSPQTSKIAAKDETVGRVGFLGLGIMGSPMAQNLINAGCDVTIWNRTKSKCDPLISLGGRSGCCLWKAWSCQWNESWKSAFSLGSSVRLQKACRRRAACISYCSMMASFSEGLLLSEKVGLNPSVLIEVVSQGAISAPMSSTKGPSMVQAIYPTAFSFKASAEGQLSTPIAAAANEPYKVAKSRALSDQDFSAVIEALKTKLQSQAKE